MIIKDKAQNEVLGIDKDVTMNMTIDDSNKKLLMMILSQGLYSDGIGSLIREYSTNALDAQREAKNDEPIKVRLIKENNKFIFTVSDEGVGLSPDRVQNVFSKYCASTKRDSEDQMGFFGLGSKSALSYTDSFQILSRYEGKEYTFMMFKGEEGTGLTVLDVNETDAHNGVTIKICLNDEDDYETFLEKMKHQLCYFEDVFIETEYDEIKSDYKIIKTNDWKYSELNQDQYIHLSLDNVYYPIDFEKLGIEPIKMPIAINLSLKDDIVPTPNRENIIYSPHVKELILGKLNKIGIYFINKWNELAPNINNIEEAHKMKDNFGIVNIYKEIILGVEKIINIKVDKKLEKVTGLEMKTVTLSLFPNLSVDKMHENISYLLQEYKTYGIIKSFYYQTKFGYHTYGEDITCRELEHNLFIPILLQSGESLTQEQVKYLKWTEKQYKIIRKHSTIKLGKFSKYGGYGTNCYRGLLNLDKKEKKLVFNKSTNKWECLWRTIINEYQTFLKQYTDKFVSISDIIPTQEFEEFKADHKAKRKTRRFNSKEEITFGRVRKTERGKNYFASDKDRKLIKDLPNMPGVFIYTHEDDIDLLKEFFNLGNAFSKCGYKPFFNKITGKQDKKYYSYNTINCIVFSDRNYEKIKKTNFHNWIELKDVFNKRNRVWAENLTQYLIDRLESRYSDNYTDKRIKLIDEDFFNKAKETHEYANQSTISSNNTNIIMNMLKIYAKNRWLNENAINQYINLTINQNKYNFLNLLNHNASNTKELKNLAIYLYLKQCRKEKQGLWDYKRVDVSSFLNEMLNYKKEDKEEKIISIEEPTEEILVLDNFPEDEENEEELVEINIDENEVF